MTQAQTKIQNSDISGTYMSPEKWLGGSDQSTSPVFVRTLVGDALNTIKDIGELTEVKLEHRYYHQHRVKEDAAETSISLFSIVETYKSDLEQIYTECSQLLANTEPGVIAKVPDTSVERLRVVLAILSNLYTRLKASQN